MAKKEQMVAGKPLTEWRARLVEGDDEERLRTVKQLEILATRAKSALPILIEALKDKQIKVRALAAKALGWLGHDALPAMDALITATTDKSSDVRCSAAYALSHIGPVAEPAIPALIKLLQIKKDQLSAAQALGAIGPAAAGAAKQIGKLFLQATRENDAFGFAEYLSKLGPAAARPLMAGLNSPDWKIRAAAAFGLCQVGPPAAKAAAKLVKLSQDKADQVRTWAISALGEIAGDPKLTVPALVKALSDDDENLKKTALAGLGKIGAAAASAVPAMAVFLTDPYVPLVIFSAEALGRIGPAAKGALPQLEEATKSKNTTVRKAAVLAIGLIRKTPEAAAKVLLQQPTPGNRTIDFAKTKAAAAHMLKDGLEQFARDHSDEKIKVVALFGQGFGASATLCIGTANDVDNEWESGACDLKYSEYAEETFGFWPDLYEVGPNFEIKMPDGKVIQHSTDDGGNEAINEPLFNLLCEVLRESDSFKQLSRAKGFRVGVEMHDSEFVKFWKPK